MRNSTKILTLIFLVVFVTLLAGCWLFPDEKLITITWFEDAVRYTADGSEHSRWYGDELGPATLIQDNGGWCFADVKEYFNDPSLDYEGIVFITEKGLLSGYATYFLSFDTEDVFIGQVEIVVDGDGTSGTMVGTYTQNHYKFGTEADIKAIEAYKNAIECEIEDKWFVGHTDYTAYPR